MVWFSTEPYGNPYGTIWDPAYFAQALSNPRVFAWAEFNVRNAFTAGGSVAQVQDVFKTFDCTDGAGHGILVATDSIFISCSQIGYTAAAPIAFKIMYRLKTVSLTEYIGIVQSQQ